MTTPTAPLLPPRVLTADVARQFDVSLATVKAMAKRDELRGFRHAGRFFITQASVAEYVARIAAAVAGDVA